METTYYLALTAEQKAELEAKFRSATFERIGKTPMGRPTYNITFQFAKDVGTFLEWCEEHNIDAELI